MVALKVQLCFVGISRFQAEETKRLNPLVKGSDDELFAKIESIFFCNPHLIGFDMFNTIKLHMQNLFTPRKHHQK